MCGVPEQPARHVNRARFPAYTFDGAARLAHRVARRGRRRALDLAPIAGACAPEMRERRQEIPCG